MEITKAQEINKDLKDWGYSSRAEFVIAAHRKEKAERTSKKQKARG